MLGFSGNHRRLTTFQTEREKTIKLFCGIYGVGRAKAPDLYDKGARSVEMLRQDPARFGLTTDIIIGLKYYEDLLERIPRDEVTELYAHAKRIGVSSPAALYDHADFSSPTQLARSTRSCKCGAWAATGVAPRRAATST